MQSLNSYKYITLAATTLFAGNEAQRVVLGAINVNKILAGTVTIRSGGASGTIIGVLAASTPIGEYWYTTTGTEIEGLAITNSQSEDITVMYRNI